MTVCFLLQYHILSVYLPHEELIDLANFDYLDFNYNDIIEKSPAQVIIINIIISLKKVQPMSIFLAQTLI